jgi:GLPGLI family protein
MKQYCLKILIIAILTSLSFQGIYAQNFQGIATYQSSVKATGFVSSLNKFDLDPKAQSIAVAAYRQTFQNEYTLTFNLTESLWKVVETLGAPSITASGNNATFDVPSFESGNQLYKNTASMQEIFKTEFSNRLMLVKNELKHREWELTNETKQIGNYVAHKAIFTRVFERKMISFDNDEDNTMKTVSDTSRIVAWYTPEIPVSHGPVRYWGLPGLILEITAGKMTYLCTKVVLNPKEGVKIKVPSKGKEITRKEWEEMNEEVTEGMLKQYRNYKRGSGSRRGRGD